MVCDDFTPGGLELLHRFASQIGLPRRAFHDPTGHPRPHYDLRPEYREIAIANGAEQLGRRELVAFLQRGRERLENSEYSTSQGQDS